MINKLVEDKINELKYFTDNYIESIHLAHIPYAYYLKYSNIFKYSFNGKILDFTESIMKIPNIMHILLVHNLPFINHTNFKTIKGTLKELIDAGEMIPFLLFVNGKLIKWSDIFVVRDYRYSYLIINNVEYNYLESPTYTCILAPFLMEYRDGIKTDKCEDDIIYFDIDGKQTTDENIVYTSVKIKDPNTTVDHLLATNAGFRFKIKEEGSDIFEDPKDLLYQLENQGLTMDLADIVSYVVIYPDEGEPYEIQIETSKSFIIPVKEYGQIATIKNCLVFKDGLLHVDLKEDFLELPLNIIKSELSNVQVFTFTYDNIAKSKDLIYKIPNKREVEYIIDNDKDTLDKISNNKFNFTMNKNKSYEFNISKAFEYISSYDFDLFNSIIKSQSKIFTIKLSASNIIDKISIDNPYYSIQRKIYPNSDKSMCMVFHNNELYKYHYLCNYSNMKFNIYVPEGYLSENDKIEVLHFVDYTNFVNILCIDKPDYKAFLLGINENNLSAYIRNFPNQLYELNTEFSYKQIDLRVSKNYPNIFTLNIDREYFNKMIYFPQSNRFAYKSTLIDEDGLKAKLDKNFTFCRNKNQYMVFINGRLVSNDKFELEIPDQDSPVNDISLYFYIPLYKNTRVDVFYIPREFINIEGNISEDGYISVPKNSINYPLDKDCYFYFLNGKKIAKDDLTNIDKYTIKLDEDLNTRDNLVILKHIDEIDDLTNAFLQESSWDIFLSSLSKEDRDKLFELTNIVLSDNEPNIYNELVSKEQLVYELIAEYYMRNGLGNGNPFEYTLDDSVLDYSKVDSEGNVLIGVFDDEDTNKINKYNTNKEE